MNETLQPASVRHAIAESPEKSPCVFGKGGTHTLNRTFRGSPSRSVCKHELLRKTVENELSRNTKSTTEEQQQHGQEQEQRATHHYQRKPHATQTHHHPPTCATRDRTRDAEGENHEKPLVEPAPVSALNNGHDPTKAVQHRTLKTN